MTEQVRTFRITNRAKADLIEIGRYTAQRWGKEQRNKYLKEMDYCFHLLARNGRLGKHRPDVHQEYFSFPQGSHVIFYMINESYIDIIGIPHRAMEVGNYI
jgi:toxin ParE1/3/4